MYRVLICLFCRDYFICKSELTEALNLLNCLQKKDLVCNSFGFVTHTPF